MRPLPKLHAVTDDTVLSQLDFDTRLRSLAGLTGVIVHLRSASHPTRHIFALAERCHNLGLEIAINDRVDIALATGAAAIHLPSHGMPVAITRRLVGSATLVGQSTHSPDEARAAHQSGADYVFLGPVWPTTSHPGRAGIGVAALSAARPARTIAIGGITPDRAAECARAGAQGVAVIEAIWQAPDTRAAAGELLLSFQT